VKRFFYFVVAAMVLVVCVAMAPASGNAAIVTLTDLNSTVSIDPASSTGVSSWTVGGVNQLFQQWFWYRVGATGGESSVDTLATAVVNQLDASTVKITYTGTGLTVSLLFALTGGTTGSGTSDLAETIKITNTSETSKSLHFFQYADSDLNGGSGGDTVKIDATNHNTVTQTKGTGTLSETVLTPAPNNWEVNYYDTTLAKLIDGSPTTLNGIVGPLGPGDMTWAFEWDQDIAAGGTLIISKDKHLAPIPLPPTVLLLGTGLLGLVGLRFRRNRA